MQALLLRRSQLIRSINVSGTWRSARWLSGKSFSKTHEWIDSDGRVGISEFAQSELGDVVYVELPEVGAKFEAGDTFGSVESVKAASDIYAPVSGEVIEVNKDLKDNPGMVNEDAEGKGWMLKFKLGNNAANEIKSLLDAKAYLDLTKK